MARSSTIEVERVDPRGENPGEKLKRQIEYGATLGKDLITVVSLFDEHLLIWRKPHTESRGKVTRPDPGNRTV